MPRPVRIDLVQFVTDLKFKTIAPTNPKINRTRGGAAFGNVIFGSVNHSSPECHARFGSIGIGHGIGIGIGRGIGIGIGRGIGISIVCEIR
jgi:hypothetical protein